MVNCFPPDCDHHSESHTCKFFRFPTADGEKKTWISLIRFDQEIESSPIKPTSIAETVILQIELENKTKELQDLT
ncbi:hypothetical protein P5673_021913 [Acropora cervicornis]|uniref:THAP-type domain-containing protein n=1 Tax=Acropora cervicornis TaxID=6130 RepID=A0AAD9V016_ACRCE|nr:hypothetical protein P5673_021913 [Acropora cervicornis]